MNKRVKVVLAALTLTFMVGCSTTKNTGSQISEEEYKEYKQSFIDAENMNKAKDAKVLKDKLNAISSFIGSTGSQLSTYMENGDNLNTVAYATGVINNDDRDDVDEIMTELSQSMTSEQGINLSRRVTNLYFEYMAILTDISESKITPDLNDRISNLNKDLNNLDEILTNMSSNQ